MVELGEPLLTLLDHDQLKVSRAVHEAFTHVPLEHLDNSNQPTITVRRILWITQMLKR